MSYYLSKSDKPSKKYKVFNGSKNIYFGASGYSDYTKHKNGDRKERYLSRHAPREDWDISGIDTAGFWSRWILWNKPTIRYSIADTERRFGIRIHLV